MFGIFSVNIQCVRCDMAFIEPTHPNRTNITYCQITGKSIVCSTAVQVNSKTLIRWPMDSSDKWPVVRKKHVMTSSWGICPSIQALGNHDFDNGVTGLVDFLDNVTFPVLAANMDYSKEPLLEGTDRVQATTILDVGGGQKIGVIGYISEEMPYLVSPG